MPARWLAAIAAALLLGPGVAARAASAGFVIAIAADVAAMAPGTNIGAISRSTPCRNSSAPSRS